MLPWLSILVAWSHRLSTTENEDRMLFRKVTDAQTSSKQRTSNRNFKKATGYHDFLLTSLLNCLTISMSPILFPRTGLKTNQKLLNSSPLFPQPSQTNMAAIGVCVSHGAM